MRNPAFNAQRRQRSEPGRYANAHKGIVGNRPADEIEVSMRVARRNQRPQPEPDPKVERGAQALKALIDK